MSVEHRRQLLAFFIVAFAAILLIGNALQGDSLPTLEKPGSRPPEAVATGENVQPGQSHVDFGGSARGTTTPRLIPEPNAAETSGQAPGQAAQSSGQTPGQTSGQTSGQAAAQASGQASGRASAAATVSSRGHAAGHAGQARESKRAVREPSATGRKRTSMRTTQRTTVTTYVSDALVAFRSAVMAGGSDGQTTGDGKKAHARTQGKTANGKKAHGKKAHGKKAHGKKHRRHHRR